MEVTVEELLERLEKCLELLRVEPSAELTAGERGALATARNCVSLAGLLLETRVLRLISEIAGTEEEDDDAGSV